MRLLFSLKSDDRWGHKTNYQYYLPSFIYRLLEGSTQFSHLHKDASDAGEYHRSEVREMKKEQQGQHKNKQRNKIKVSIS